MDRCVQNILRNGNASSYENGKQKFNKLPLSNGILRKEENSGDRALFVLVPCYKYKYKYKRNEIIKPL